MSCGLSASFQHGGCLLPCQQVIQSLCVSKHTSLVDSVTSELEAVGRLWVHVKSRSAQDQWSLLGQQSAQGRWSALGQGSVPGKVWVLSQPGWRAEDQDVPEPGECGKPSKVRRQGGRYQATLSCPGDSSSWSRCAVFFQQMHLCLCFCVFRIS